MRSYFDAVNVAIGGGETSGLLAFSTADCPCRKLADSVAQVFAEGRSVGAVWTLVSIEPGDPRLDKSLATVVYTTAPYRNESATGETVDSFPGYQIESAVLVVLRNGEWRVRDFQTLSKAEVG